MIIETLNLTKYYGNKIGCAKICLSVSEGQVFGFLGPNGAGKSTLVKMLVGLIHPTGGAARILGKPLGDLTVRRRLGFLPEHFSYQDWLTGRELLLYHSRLYGISGVEVEKRVKSVIDMVGLTGKENYKIGTYSRGMQQRIGLASALLPDPDLLFLDEPTSALDPVGRKEVRELIRSLKRRGKTIFLNSHLLGEVELVCDAVAIIKDGRIVTAANMKDLRHLSGLQVTLEELKPEVIEALEMRGYRYTSSGTTLHVDINDRQEIPIIADLVVTNGGRVYQLNPVENSLESIFLEHLGRGGE